MRVALFNRSESSRSVPAARRVLTPLIATLCALGSTTVFAFAGDKIEYGPKLGELRKKVLDVKHYVNLQSTTTTRDSGVELKDPTTGAITTWERVVFLDRVEQHANGRPTSFVRNYSALDAGGTAELVIPDPKRADRISKQATTEVSNLLKHDVRFTWVDAEKTWARMYDRLDGEEWMLAAVDGDIDFCSVVPNREVNPGDTWDVPIDRAVSLLAPGGSLALLPKQKKPFPRTVKVGIGGDLGELLEHPEGAIHASYVGKRTVDGVECAVLGVQLQVTSSTDRLATVLEYLGEPELKEPARYLTCVLKLEIQGKGEVLWNLAEKRFQRFEFSGNEKFHLEGSRKFLGEGEVTSSESQLTEFDGTLNLSVTNSAPDAETADPAKKPVVEKKPDEKKN